MPDLDLAALRRVAEAATPGPWSAETTGRAHGDHWYVCADDEAIAHVSAQDGINEAQRQPDAEYIATFNPPTVKALLDRLEAAEADVERYRVGYAALDATVEGFYRVAKDLGFGGRGLGRDQAVLDVLRAVVDYHAAGAKPGLVVDDAMVERGAAAAYFNDCGVAPDETVRASEEYEVAFRAYVRVVLTVALGGDEQ